MENPLLKTILQIITIKKKGQKSIKKDPKNKNNKINLVINLAPTQTKKDLLEGHFST